MRTLRTARTAAVLVTFAVSSPFLAGCSDDSAAERSPTTEPGESPLDAPGGHDASVVVHYTITGDGSGTDPERDALAELEDRLTDAIEKRGIGELEGDRFVGDQVIITIVGPDLDRLWRRVEPILRSYPARPARAELRSHPDRATRRVTL